ncbi:hypothetical protein B0H63DRAFT_76614 [Podospora didyma]|uniref:F-box domain-containing protein n=1 Tax=Podospora didyma TaxID=330526 RepID=A0AAE0K2Z8_9PEZI|nr:hypothetical protein B0H63DRAFT_76614 [Podospora didyma]
MATTPPRVAAVASRLEQLPLELHEPILAQLSLRDIIALHQCAGEGSRIEAAMSMSPKWKPIWPMYMAHKDDFQTLASFIVPVGARKFDPTNGALDVTPGQFHRRVARRRETRADGWPNYDFLRDTINETARSLRDLIYCSDDATLACLCEELPLGLGHVARFEAPTTTTTHSSSDVDPPGQLDHLYDEDFSAAGKVLKKCRRFFDTREVPGSATFSTTVAQIKTFLDAYSVAQTRINTLKAEQLKTLSGLYAQHHTRLREPRAPQSPRKNPKHVPEQLHVATGFVMRIVDLEPGLQRGRRQAKSRFRYPHACLIPYDWCLQLYIKVIDSHPESFPGLTPLSLGSSSLEKSIQGLTISDDKSSSSSSTSPSPLKTAVPCPSENILKDIQTVNDGLKTYYMRDVYRGIVAKTPLGAKPPAQRVKQWPDGTPVFAVDMHQAYTHGGRSGILPPVDSREITWLEAFLRSVKWMEKAFPDLAEEAKLVKEEEEKEEEEEAEEEEEKEEFPPLKEVNKNFAGHIVWPSVGSARRA